MIKVGIPHSLFYFYYYPLWKTFFEELGAQVVRSHPTSRLTVDQGVRLAVDEACFPIKVYFGHVKELADRGVDYLFVPRLVSVEPKSYICPKFMGLPDMIRACISHLPPLIDITVDVSKTDKFLHKDIIRVGRIFGASSKSIRAAYQKGLQELRFCRALATQGLTPQEAIRVWEGDQAPEVGPERLRLGVLGHGYSLYDGVISMNLIQHLRTLGCRAILAEHVDPGVIEIHAATLCKRVFWTLGRNMVGSALHFDQDEQIDGIVYLACFGCGPDSLIGEIIERRIVNKPFIMLTVDEHTGEAGMITRLEAFVDMIERNRRRAIENHFSAHG
ncbi:MAG TPA: acyl-CoA dehydratase activase-related protein [Syntrophomonadaceae bacterium]|nr:acyl-CoA dehydratase activase-related protein [Syntrophomonadaceae bacterium]HQE23850.1 acyl-CoA dehydratase activase-related protein [Syntrophomonadaceae bacterium]